MRFTKTHIMYKNIFANTHMFHYLLFKKGEGAIGRLVSFDSVLLLGSLLALPGLDLHPPRSDIHRRRVEGW